MKNQFKFEIIICISILSTNVFAQKCIQKTNEYKLNGSTWIETKSVLATDTVLKYGFYSLKEKKLKDSINRNAINNIYSEDSLFYYILCEEGFYKNNQKDSIWTEFFGLQFYRVGIYKNNKKTGEWKEYFNNKLCGIGHYEQGKKNCIWQYYSIHSNRDSVYLRYDYNKNMVIRKKNEVKKENEYKFNISNNKDGLVEQPIFLYGGFSGYQEMFSHVNMYGIPNYIVGSFSVLTQISIDSLGLTQFKLIKIWKDEQGIIKSRYEQLLNQMPKEWLPAKLNNNIPQSCSTHYFSKFNIE